MTSRVVVTFSIAFVTVVLSSCRSTGGTQSVTLTNDQDVAPTPAEEQAIAQTVLPAALKDLKDLKREELDVLFRGANGDVAIPLGEGKGYPILIADASLLNGLANQVWGGKHFRAELDEETGEEIVTLKNYIGPSSVSLKMIRARVFKGRITDARATLGTAAIDQQPSIVLNYGDKLLGNLPPFNKIVDEIRLLNPETGLYLGRAHLYDKFICYFALQFGVE